MEAEDVGRLALHALGAIEPGAQGQAVEGRVTDELGGRERREIDARVGAASELSKAARGDVEDVDIGRCRRAETGHGEAAAAGVVDEVGADLGGQARARVDLAGAEVDETELAASRDIPDEGSSCAGVIESEVVELRVGALGQHLDGSG
jgi:hypothetical protein